MIKSRYFVLLLFFFRFVCLHHPNLFDSSRSFLLHYNFVCDVRAIVKNGIPWDFHVYAACWLLLLVVIVGGSVYGLFLLLLFFH